MSDSNGTGPRQHARNTSDNADGPNDYKPRHAKPSGPRHAKPLTGTIVEYGGRQDTLTDVARYLGVIS